MWGILERETSDATCTRIHVRFTIFGLRQFINGQEVLLDYVTGGQEDRISPFGVEDYIKMIPCLARFPEESILHRRVRVCLR